MVVSTEDEEIAKISKSFGVDVILRSYELASDQIALDSVVKNVTLHVERNLGKRYETICTVQPTTPLVTSSDITHCIDLLEAGDADTVITATKDTHLRWQKDEWGNCIPCYSERVNRQDLPATYRETGAVIGCRRDILDSGGRIGNNITLYEMPPERSVDIDSPEDFLICEALLRQKRIVIVTVGRPSVGTGHAARSLLIANEMVGHEVLFVCRDEDYIAIDYAREGNYPVYVCDGNVITTQLRQLNPDLVINDILDTSADYVQHLQEYSRVVNFEDLGPGAEYADLVINALYPHTLPEEHIRSGGEFCCLRDEFFALTPKPVSEVVRRVLVTVGGVDPGDLAARLVTVIGPAIEKRGIALVIVLGPGYEKKDELDDLIRGRGLTCCWVNGPTGNIADHMHEADLAITSGGRTVLELVSLRVPSVVLCQNGREMTHMAASSYYGIMNLGLHTEVTDSQIHESVTRLLDDVVLRKEMHDRMGRLDVRGGRSRVIREIQEIIG